MTTLVQDLLTLEHARNYQRQLQPLDLADLAEEVAEDAKALAAKHTVTCRTPPGSHPRVSGDLESSRRALWVLVENAFKYAPTGSTIELSLALIHQRWQIAVANTGSPIPADELDHVFDRFYRGRNTRRISGSGLGLAIAKALMENQHGGITVQSDAKRTVFGLWWPR
jgi:signal transduction histidine kinase